MKTLCIAAAAVIGFTATLSAQTLEPPDTFKVGYYSNANEYAPDATLRITNVGTQLGGPNAPGLYGFPQGTLAAFIFVLSPDQQVAECCACAITPDGLLTLSIDSDLTSNPLTPVTLNNGDIKIVSTNLTTTPSSIPPVAGIRAWSTHIQANSITETEFSDSTLSAGELKTLEGKCSAIFRNGSGYGICGCGVPTEAPAVQGGGKTTGLFSH
jgi:hypothetical protein